MLKKTVTVLVVLTAGAFLWLMAPARPSVEAVAKLAGIKISRETEVRSFERISNGREPEFIATLSVPEGGDKFCKINNLTEKNLQFEPFYRGQKGYDLLLGSPGVCYGVRKLGNGGVFIVVRQREVVIYVDDR